MYDDLQDAVNELLGEFDQRTTKIKIVRNSGGGVSATTGLYVDGTETEYELTGIVSPYAKSGDSIKSGDLRLSITSDVEPLSNDSIVIDGNSYSIISINKVNPGGTTLMYILQVRR